MGEGTWKKKNAGCSSAGPSIIILVDFLLNIFRSGLCTPWLFTRLLGKYAENTGTRALNPLRQRGS